ncbi:hypothetical protein [Singulisphaera acidiphila]|uniref:Uncharacterized protein n=1 Tax=Singulisphaera acidiphila (strain ATCC BAA-1392 / DSM 18658 / VKM B-2454 / MOB10) TaxID=886293 RepID=L0DRM8_SINAD|nr:hypothetical protein [Singulisphaera acidiphila]AGA31637.1 hypothetical protein Sinac_7606 [Singulisphaera acidiphila DSM 18658]
MKRYRTITEQQSYNRVLLALHWLSDEDALACNESDLAIAVNAGRSARTVRRYIRHLEQEERVAVFYSSQWLSGRSIVFLDDEAELVDTWIISYYLHPKTYPQLSPHSVSIRGRVEHLIAELA